MQEVVGSTPIFSTIKKILIEAIWERPEATGRSSVRLRYSPQIWVAFYAYILRSLSNGRYYVGSCENVEQRLGQHNTGKNSSTKSGIPWELKKVETFVTRKEAYQREQYIKRMKSTLFIEKVINGER
jgi:putative endonuclease